MATSIRARGSCVTGLVLMSLQLACAEEPATLRAGATLLAEETVRVDEFADDHALDAGLAAAPHSADTGAPAASLEPAAVLEDAGASDTCEADTRGAYKIFSNRCVICHVGAGRGHGGFGGVLSARSMVATGHVVPGAPERSKVYLRVESGDMPRSGPRLTEVELARMAGWITCGAPTFAEEAARGLGGVSDGGGGAGGGDAVTDAEVIVE